MSDKLDVLGYLFSVKEPQAGAWMDSKLVWMQWWTFKLKNL